MLLHKILYLDARNVAAACVERTGGQGYLSANRLGELIVFSHSGITAEGDNRVLMQKVTKELMSMGTIHYLSFVSLVRYIRQAHFY